MSRSNNISAEPVAVISTIDSDKQARKIAKTLVKEKLVACVNIVPKVTSIYGWKGKLCEEAELLLVMKTMSDRIESLKVRLKDLHPYDIPELLVLPITAGSKEYLDWVIDQTG